jgi:hypothetical protein
MIGNALDCPRQNGAGLRGFARPDGSLCEAMAAVETFLLLLPFILARGSTLPT